MDDALAAYTEARSVEERLSGRAQELRRRFNDEQAGALASSLRDGEPCPVCGALTHPHPAQCAPDAPDEKAVKDAEKKARAAQKNVNEASAASGSAKTLYLCAITNTSASGAPSIAMNYGAIGSIGRGETATFSIPVAAVQGLSSGAYGGLCLYESPYNFGSSTYSKCYMRMSGSGTSQQPYLRVVYNGGDAVG